MKNCHKSKREGRKAPSFKIKQGPLKNMAWAGPGIPKSKGVYNHALFKRHDFESQCNCTMYIQSNTHFTLNFDSFLVILVLAVAP